jgi:hypothetical protein
MQKGEYDMKVLVLSLLVVMSVGCGEPTNNVKETEWAISHQLIAKGGITKVCIEGFTFYRLYNSAITNRLDADGKPVPCDINE